MPSTDPNQGVPGHVPVCVVGGGPAGCIAAIQLARVGHHVVLVDHPGSAKASRCESLSPGAREQLEFLGLSEVIDHSCLGGLARKSLLWGTEEPVRLETNGTLVDRARFDACLMRLALREGVMTFQVESRVSVNRTDSDHWLIQTRHNTPFSLTADFLIDATGSAAGLTIKQCRISPPLISISARLPSAGLPPNEMFVEAFETGWMWLATADEEWAYACFFGASREAFGDDVITALAQITSISRLIDRNIPASNIYDCVARNASSYRHPGCAAGSFCAVGDASLSRDPLLSHGLQWAITSAISGAAVANTILSVPERTELAVRFHQYRQDEAERSSRLACTSFYRECYAFMRSPFWQARAHAPKATQRTPNGIPRQGCDDWLVTFSPYAQIRGEPVLREGRIEENSALFHPSLPRPIAFVRNVPIDELVSVDETRLETKQLTDSIAKKLGSKDARNLVNYLIEMEVLVSVPESNRANAMSDEASTKRRPGVQDPDRFSAQ